MDVFQHEIGLLQEAEGGLRESLSAHHDWPAFERTGHPPASLASDPRFRAWRAITESLAALYDNAGRRKAHAQDPPQDLAIASDAASANAQDTKDDGPSVDDGSRSRVGREGDSELTRIRGIDRVTASLLNEAGVHRIEQIAQWQAEDVAAMSDLLGGRARIARENWIERAAALVLASEGELTVVKVQDTPPTCRATAPEPCVDLMSIRGISEPLANKLRLCGASSVGDIAAWSASDVARFAGLVGTDGDIYRDNWIEQAVLLAGGAQTYFSESRKRPRTPVVPMPAPEPWTARLAPQIGAGENPARDAAVDGHVRSPLTIDERIARLRQEVAQIRTLPAFTVQADPSAPDEEATRSDVGLADVEMPPGEAPSAASDTLAASSDPTAPDRVDDMPADDFDDSPDTLDGIDEADVSIVVRARPVASDGDAVDQAATGRRRSARQRTDAGLDTAPASARYREIIEEASVQIVPRTQTDQHDQIREDAQIGAAASAPETTEAGRRRRHRRGTAERSETASQAPAIALQRYLKALTGDR